MLGPAMTSLAGAYPESRPESVHSSPGLWGGHSGEADKDEGVLKGEK